MNKTFLVNGMKCEHCKAHVESALKDLCGVNAVEVSLSDHCVNVDFDENKVDAQQMKEAVEAAGRYELEI